MSTTPVPTGFWKQIDHQLNRIATEKTYTFDKVRTILLDPAYNEVREYVHRNGERIFDNNTAFFAGSGGDPTLKAALHSCGWELLEYKASYYYTVQNTRTGETLSYIEGDVQRGNCFA